MDKIKTCLINMELVLDYQSLVLAMLKLEQPMLVMESNDIQQNPIQFLKSLDQLLNYLSVIKPQIGVFETISCLKTNDIEVKIYTSLDSLIAQEIRQTHQFITIENDIIDIVHEYQNPLIIDTRIDVCRELQKQNYNVMLIKNYCLKNKDYWANIANDITVTEKFEDIDWSKFGIPAVPKFQHQQFKVNAEPNEAAQYWKQYITMSPPICIRSKITHGFNRGGSMLGIPTANLLITNEISENIRKLVPGVYMGISQLNNISYGAVLSIGYNPYFHNHDKSIEVHLLSDFDHDFYDSELSLEIVHFLRPESDFKCFDHLIKYINNDKWLAQLLFK